MELAEKKKLLLGCSPFVILGEAQQTLWKAVRDGMIGKPLEVVAHIMHGRIEKRNPNPVPFLSLDRVEAGDFEGELFYLVFPEVLKNLRGYFRSYGHEKDSRLLAA